MTRVLRGPTSFAKVRVIAVDSGFDTQGHMRKTFESLTPLGRIGETREVVFFASDDSKWITGETLVIAGGLR